MLRDADGLLELQDEPVQGELVHRVDDAELAHDEVQARAADREGPVPGHATMLSFFFGSHALPLLLSDSPLPAGQMH